MANSQFLGNGIGMLYVVAPDGATLIASQPNTPSGVRDMRTLGASCAPIAAVRSAVATVTFTATPAGNVTAVTINAVNQISGNVAMIAGNPTLSAVAVANAINLFSPGSGPNYTASSVGNTVFIFSPPSDGDTSNGLVVTVSVSTIGITFTKTDFSGGSDETGVYDSVVGLRFWFDQKGNAPRNSFGSGEEITKYMVLRGLQTGIVTKSLSVNNDRLTGIDRSCAITNIFVDTQSSAATDELSFIETVDFVEGDVIKLSQFIAGRVVVVTDSSVSVGVGNLFLTDGVSFNCQDNKSIELQLKYDPTLGPIWVENGRSISGGAVQLTRIEMRALIAAGAVQQGQSYFITDVGQAGIIVSGIDSNSITSLGDYVGYFPDYQNVSGDFARVWYFFLASVITGSLYAYKGLMYESLTGITGTDPSTEVTDWALIPITDSRYQKEILTVQYDVDANRVTQASDQRGNIVTGITGAATFKWGCDTCSGNTITNSQTEIYDVNGNFNANTLVASDITFPSGLNGFSNNTFTDTRIILDISSLAESILMISCFGVGTYNNTITLSTTGLGQIQQSVFLGNGYQLTGIGTVDSCVFSSSKSSVVVNCAGFNLLYSQISNTVTLVQNKSGLTVNASSSNYEVANNISAQVGTGYIYASASESASVIVLTSATTKTISSIILSTAVFPDFPVTFKAAIGTTIIMQPIAIGSAASGDIVNSSLTAITLVGRTNGSDFCTIQKNGNVYSVINSKIHV